MNLTFDQLRIIEDALLYSCEVLSTEFDNNKDSPETAKMQKAVDAYGKLRRFNRVLKEIKEGSTPLTRETKGNNVLTLAAANRR